MAEQNNEGNSSNSDSSGSNGGSSGSNSSSSETNQGRGQIQDTTNLQSRRVIVNDGFSKNNKKS